MTARSSWTSDLTSPEPFAYRARAQMPRPPRQRGSSVGHSEGSVQVFEQRSVSVPSIHRALSQSFSPVQVEPAAPAPRGPGMQ